MKIKLLTASFGFDKGGIYEATKHCDGFFVVNGSVSRFIKDSDCELIKE